MATSGSFNTSAYSNRYLTFSWSVKTQDITNNRTIINWSLKGAGGDSTWYESGNFKVVINGTTVYSSSTRIKLSKGTVVKEGTATIPHNSDGTKSFSASAQAGIFTVAVNCNGSGSWALPTIARKSTVTCNSFNIGDSTTITIAKASSSFTHTITFNYGSKSGTIATNTSETSIGWTPNKADFYSEISRGRTGTGTVTCETFNGTTSLGTTTAKFNAYAVESDAKPTVSATIVDTNTKTTALTGNSSKLIKYISKPKVTITATPKYSSIIEAYSILNGDGSYSNLKEYTFSNGVASPTFNVSATDSRQYSTTYSTNLSSSSKWIEYIKVAITSIQLVRTESTGNEVILSIKGNYFNGNFGATTNSLTLKYMFKEVGGSYGNYQTITPTISGNTFSAQVTLSKDYKKEYVFIVSAEDKLMAYISEEQPLPKGEAVFRIGEDYIKTNGKVLDENNNDLSIVAYNHSDYNGYIHYANGLLRQWGRIAITATTANTVASAKVIFPLTYDEVPKVSASPQISVPTAVTTSIGGGTTVEISKQSMMIYMTRINTISTPFHWEAVGYKEVIR